MPLQIAPTRIVRVDYEASSLAGVVSILPSQEAGRCEWDIQSAYGSTDSRGMVRNVTVTVTITISLPRWVGRDKAPAPERAEWDRFLRALEAHERGHERIVRDGTPAMTRRLEGARATAFSDTHHEESDRIQERSDSYDQRTNHGRTPLPGTNITIPAAALSR